MLLILMMIRNSFFHYFFFRWPGKLCSIDDDILNLMDEVNVDELLREAASVIDDPDKLAQYIREKATIAIERFLVRRVFLLLRGLFHTIGHQTLCLTRFLSVFYAKPTTISELLTKNVHSG
jgi:hypothetical protein